IPSLEFDLEHGVPRELCWMYSRRPGVSDRICIGPGIRNDQSCRTRTGPDTRLNQFDVGLKKTIRFRERYVVEPEVQVFNILTSNVGVTEAVSLAGDATAFLPKAACTASSPANCGLGGTVTTITNPRLLRLAMLFRF